MNEGGVVPTSVGTVEAARFIGHSEIGTAVGRHTNNAAEHPLCHAVLDRAHLTVGITDRGDHLGDRGLFRRCQITILHRVFNDRRGGLHRVNCRAEARSA
jgi:hypothetical protein